MTYLLTCVCGKNVPVEVGQAGGQISCACGAQLDVPPLRKLRHLPPAQQEVPAASTQWSARRGVVAASLIIAGVLAGVTFWLWRTEPHPAEFDPVAHMNAVDERMKAITPALSFEYWVGFYRPLAERGFSVLQDSRTAMFAQQVVKRRFLEFVLLTLAGLAVLVAAAVAFWPAAKRGRVGEGETRRSG